MTPLLERSTMESFLFKECSALTLRKLVSILSLLLLLTLASCGPAPGSGASNASDMARESLVAVTQINSGSTAGIGSFEADRSFSGGSTYLSTNTINTAGVANAAPAAVYQSERYGNFSYTIGGLASAASYTVRLHFAEIVYSGAGHRIFNVSINGSQVLTNFDIFAYAGQMNKAVALDFTTVATSRGEIVITYSSVADFAKSSGVEIFSAASAPPPSNQSPTVATSASANPASVAGTTTQLSVLGADDGGEANLTYTWSTSGTPPAPVSFSPNGSNAAKQTTATFTASGSYSLVVAIADAQGSTVRSTIVVSVTVPQTPETLVSVLQINSGSTTAAGSFSPDQFFNTGSTYTSANSISTSGVANAAPMAVYQSERYGNFSYTIGGLTAAANYVVRLHFAEVVYPSVGSRIFNVTINGARVLSDFDIVAAAGQMNKALVRDFNAVATGQGQIVVLYSSVRDLAKSSGIEILARSGGGSAPPPSNQPPTVATGAAANPAAVTGTTTNLSVLGADDGGEANLVYSWATTGSPPAPVSFSVNGNNAAKKTTATFSASGNYTLNVTIADAKGSTVQSSVSVAVTVPTAPGAPGGAGWQLVWADEFNGSSVDTTRWRYWLDGQTRRAAINRAANTFVSGGALTVRISNPNGQLTAGGLESNVGFGYGYFETRSKVVGGWAAFWLQSPGIGSGGTPAVDGTEMDIMEACCPGPVQHAVHWGGYGAGHQFTTHTISGVVQSNWNTYGLEWTPTSYKFWVNGQLSWTFTTAISQRSDEVIRLTQETDGDFCGSQCDYLVDYVRVYRSTQ